MFVYKTSLDGALGALDEAAGAVALLERVSGRSGQPFILAADGRYDVELNRFLR